MANHPNRSKRRAIEFVTLTTGGATISQRREVEAATMEIAASLLRGQVHPDGWAVALTATHPTSHAYDVLIAGQRLSACYLCASDAASDALWEIAETLTPAQTVLHRPRGVPWLACALMPDAAALDRDLLLALPWLELAVAWHLLETTR